MAGRKRGSNASALTETLHKIEDRYRELHHLEQSLVDLPDRHRPEPPAGRTCSSRHAHGSVPADNLARLQGRARTVHHLILNVAGEGETLRILVAGRREDRRVLDSVLPPHSTVVDSRASMTT